MKATLWSLFQPTCAVIVPRLCYTGFIFSQPLLTRRLINYIGERDTSVNTARGLIGATVLIYLGIAISKAAYLHLNYRLVTLARGVLISQILAKSLRIPYSEASKKSALSNMSTDIEGLVTGLPMMHDIWVSFIEIGIGAYILTTVVGRAAFLVVLPLVCEFYIRVHGFNAICATYTLTDASFLYVSASTLMSLLMGKRLIPARKAWNDKIDYRVSQTASLLTYTKGIKMLALESPATLHLQSLRVAELNESKKFRVLALTLNIACKCR